MIHRIQTPEPGRVLQEEFKVAGGLAPQLDDTVIPVSILSDLRGAVAPPGARRCSAHISIAAGAGYPNFSLDAPPGVVAQVLSYGIWTGFNVPHLAVFDAGAGAAGAAQTRAFTDTRTLIGTGNTPFCSVLGGNTGALFGTPEWERVEPTTGQGLWYEPPGWFVYNPPGGGGTRSIHWQPGSFAGACQGSIEWVEWSIPND